MAKTTKVQGFSFDELKQMLIIDEHRLDNDCRNQPYLYQTVCDKVSEAFKLWKDAESTLDSLSAKIARDLKAAAGDKDPSDASIKRAIESDAQAVDIRALVRQTEANFKEWDFLRRAYEQRLPMLQEYSRILASVNRQYSA